MAVGNAVPYMGWKSCIGVEEETTFGTFKTATAFIEFNSEGFKREREEMLIESVNNNRYINKRIVGNETVSGNIEADLDVGSDGLMFIVKQAMGGTVTTVANTNASADEYTHTFAVGDMENNKATSTASDVKALSFSVMRGDTATVFTYEGCRVNTLVIKSEGGAPVMLSAEVIGEAASITTTFPAISYSDLVPLYFKDVTFATGDSVTNVGTEWITSFELSINNNLDGDQRALGTRNIVQLPPNKRNISLKITQRFDTMTSYNRFISNTLTGVKITLSSEQTVGAGTANSVYSMIINLPEVFWNSNEPQVGGNETLTHEVEATALYNSEQGYDCQIVVYNGTSGYF